MKYSEETIEKFLSLIVKENDIITISKEMEITPFEVLGLVNYVKEKGNNIAVKKTQDNIYMVNMGDIEYTERNTYNFETDDSNEFKFIAISDPRLGSKYQQLSILNDIYTKGAEMGYNNVILCGNVSAGLYSLTDPNAETIFADDTYSQIDYIVNHYPQIEGMKTYFITGKRDGKHLKNEKIDIGKRIAEQRDDMIYLGNSSCEVKIDNATMHIVARKLGKTYTVSYRPQQQIDSYRSEDKPDILLYGGLLQMEKFTYRNVRVISVPSVVATTKEMQEKRYSNTIGAWYVTVRTNSKGELESVRAISSPYYVTNKDDYLNAKVLKPTPPKKGKVKTKKKEGVN